MQQKNWWAIPGPTNFVSDVENICRYRIHLRLPGKRHYLAELITPVSNPIVPVAGN
jgi:hypothetical protein